MKKILSFTIWLIIFVIIASFWKDIYNFSKNYILAFNTTKNINVFEIKINDKIDQYFTKNEIEKYYEDIGLNKDFKNLNIYNTKEKFLYQYDAVQIIYEDKTKNIWSVTTVSNIDPEKCLVKRNEKFNEFKILYKIRNNDDRLMIQNEYKLRTLNRKVAKISYDLKDELSVARITCYDNREAKPPEGKPFRYDGELRFELLNRDLKKVSQSK